MTEARIHEYGERLIRSVAFPDTAKIVREIIAEVERDCAVAKAGASQGDIVEDADYRRIEQQLG